MTPEQKNERRERIRRAMWILDEEVIKLIEENRSETANLRWALGFASGCLQTQLDALEES